VALLAALGACAERLFWRPTSAVCFAAAGSARAVPVGAYRRVLLIEGMSAAAMCLLSIPFGQCRERIESSRPGPTDVLAPGHTVQMERVDTALVHAQVIDGQAFGEFSDVKHVRDAVRQERLAVKCELPITVLCNAACPLPAVTPLLDLGPEVARHMRRQQ